MTATFYVGDAIETMDKLPENSVDLILTSPPFLALRSYLPADHPDKALEGGSQATPGMYIDWLVDVVEACDRVLAPHGSLCIELGDTYAGSGGGGGDYLEGGWREGQAQFAGSAASMKESNAAHWRQKNSNISAWPLAKSLSLIPELFRLTLVYGTNPLTGRTTDRWRLRNVVRWFKPNPPVGALGDKTRPGTSEFMVFCKSAKRYFDLDAVRTPADPTNKRPSVLKRESIPGRTDQVMNPLGDDGQRIISNSAGAPPLDWFVEDDLEWEDREGFILPPGGYPGSHYAVFSPKAIARFVKAMAPQKVCRVCGEPQRRITERTPEYAAARAAIGDFNTDRGPGEGYSGSRSDLVKAVGRDITSAENVTVGWTDCSCLGWHTCDSIVDCSCSKWRPGLVLDPFGGSGTTALVATGHGRDCVLIDLDRRNVQLARERVGFFLTVEGDEDTESVKLVEPPVLGSVAGNADDKQVVDSVGVLESTVEADG